MNHRIALLMALAGSLALGAPPQFPDTPAARQCAAWLEAFNAPDRAEFPRFLEKNYPTARMKDEDGQFRDQTGGFEFKRAEESTPTHFTGLVQERGSDQFARLAIEVEAAPPHRITRM